MDETTRIIMLEAISLTDLMLLKIFFSMNTSYTYEPEEPRENFKFALMSLKALRLLGILGVVRQDIVLAKGMFKGAPNTCAK